MLDVAVEWPLCLHEVSDDELFDYVQNFRGTAVPLVCEVLYPCNNKFLFEPHC